MVSMIPEIDKPGIKDAEQTLFACLTDGFPEEHSLGEGFRGGTPPSNGTGSVNCLGLQ